MKLSELLQDTATDRDIEITGLTADSRAVKAGFLFAALPGTQVDGAKFIGDAIKAGAAAILCRPDAVLDDDSVIWITDPIPARLFAHVAGRFFDRKPDVIAAVTGTNGKTTTARML
ncbi:MAG: UDP-N-acetylmuramoyl-L-alanyl-D-glutamate--2,6-diaminopimelate ligase, partial [Alphaproteobacteria bacterium]